MLLKKKVYLIFVLLLTIALISGCSSNSSNNTVSYYDVYGTITTQEFNSPIEGAEVTISDKTATTDSEGKYSVNDIEKGNHVWEVKSNKYQNFTYEVNIDGNSKIDQQLALKGGTASVSGSITLYNDTGYTMTQSTTKEKQNVTLNTIKEKNEYKNGEVIVKYKESLSTQTIQNVQSQQDLQKMSSINSKSGKMVRYKISTGKSVKEMINYYESLPEVEWAEPNYLMYSLAVPSDPDYSSQWGFVNLNLEAAWDQQKNSDSVTVAIIDSGIIPDHPDLTNNLLSGADFVGDNSFNTSPSDYDVTDFDPTDETTYSNNGSHGTHVAGIVGAVSNNDRGVAGVNWSTNLLPIRVIDANGDTNTWDVSEGIYYALDRGAEVINLSLGGGAYNNTQHTAIQEAYNSGAVIIAATGNSGSDSIDYPAAYDETISVGATDINNNLADYSNYGPKLDLVAPGGTDNYDISNSIYSTWGYYDGSGTVSGYSYKKGTSMATPFVSGIAALLIANGVNPRDVRNRLTSTAIDLGPSGRDDDYGYGLVDAYGALLGKKLKNPYVFAANKENGNLYVKSEMIRINDDGSYNLNEVVAEEVYIVGWRDVNENQKVDAGDYLGEYSSTINASENSQYTASFNMFYVTESSSTSMEVKGLPEVETK